MTTYRFTGPHVVARRTGECPTCGKKVTRSRTFEHTVNPFNYKIVDGERVQKTWDEVRADVQAKADAWTPPPEAFEHTRCRGVRLAPPRAEPVGVPADRVVLATRVRSAMTALITFTEKAALSLRSVAFSRRRTVPPSPDAILADLGRIPDGEIIMWARACELAELRVYGDNGVPVVRLRAELPTGVTIKAYALIANPEGRDRLGGAAITWDHDKTGMGTVTVDDLAEGLAVLGVAVVDPHLPVRAEL